MVGSVAGGKWSDVYLRRLREANNGVSVPEVCQRLSTFMTAIRVQEWCWPIDETKRNTLVHACPSRFFPHIRLDSRITRQHCRNSHLTILCWSISNVDIRLYLGVPGGRQSRMSPPLLVIYGKQLMKRADQVLLYLVIRSWEVAWLVSCLKSQDLFRML